MGEFKNIRGNPELDEKLAFYLKKAISEDAMKNLAKYINDAYRRKNNI